MTVVNTHPHRKKFSLVLRAYIARILLLLSTCATVVMGQTADEIIRRSEDAIKGESSHGTFSMTVVTEDYSRSLEMESWWVGTEKALIVIRSPKREAGNKTLKVNNELWMYLRNTETTIKVPPSMMLQSWNGSDFTNDDLVRESDLADDYRKDIILEEPVDGEQCWKVELLPKPQAPVVWGRLHYWVRKSDFLPAKVDFYDEKGELIRTLDYSLYKMLGGRKLPTKWVMLNRKKPGQRTEFLIHAIQFDIKISDKVFSFRELERGH
jgi:outer membrane lipoprotein-sorting protein